MNVTDWTEIPGRLKEAGFAVLYDRVSYEPDRPLWCAKARRDGREWSTLGENLCAAFLELEKETMDTGETLLESVVSETQATKCMKEALPEIQVLGSVGGLGNGS